MVPESSDSETESRMVVPKGWRGEEDGESLFSG